jgi:hypothetical protein
MENNTELKTKITVRKLPNGTFMWALPTHGRMETGNVRYLEHFMETKNLEYEIQEVTNFEAFKLNN